MCQMKSNLISSELTCSFGLVDTTQGRHNQVWHSHSKPTERYCRLQTRFTGKQVAFEQCIRIDSKINRILIYTLFDIIPNCVFYSSISVIQKESGVPTAECALLCVHLLSNGYEPKFGGFSSGFRANGPKFPEPVNFNFLFNVYAMGTSAELRKQCLEMCLYTLKKMAHGGIHDHVGQVSILVSAIVSRLFSTNQELLYPLFRDSRGILWTASGMFRTLKKCSTIRLK